MSTDLWGPYINQYSEKKLDFATPQEYNEQSLKRYQAGHILPLPALEATLLGYDPRAEKKALLNVGDMVQLLAQYTTTSRYDNVSP